MKRIILFLIGLYLFNPGTLSITYADTSHCGNLATDEIWASADNVHIVTCDVTVPNGLSLTITEGTIVKFALGAEIYVDGTLEILGSANNPVYLTSLRDDTIGGDTNGDGGATVPVWTDWRGIEFRAGSDDINSVIQHTISRYSGRDYRANITLVNSSPTITDSSFSDSHMAIYADLTSTPILTNNTYIDNHINGLGYAGGTIESNTVWDVTDTSYYITNDIYVGTGITLAINPGVIVKFEIGRDLTIDGALQVQGTTDSPVYFTSIRDDVVGGDTNGDGGASTPGWNNWRGIEFRDGSIDASSIIDHAVIRYAGYDYRGLLTLSSASPTIANTTLSNGHVAIRANVSSFPTLTNNTYINNYYNGFGYEGGTINTDSTWNITDTSYFIINDIFVATGSTLTVNPGVIVKFDIGRDLTIDGALQVQGTADSSVYFTSIRDDVVGGDTNGDGGASTPGWNNWRGIEFRDGSIDASSIIDHAVIRYAGYDYRGLLTLSSASPTIANTTLSNGHVAIRANVSSFPTLTNNTYINNYYNGFGYEGGTINSDSTWNITDTSYFIINDIFVATGSTLTVNPGVIVKFDIGRDLTIDGALQVQGTTDSPVYFTSIRDDVVGGDTNGDGGASTPGWNNWRGIEFRDGSIDASSIIDHAVIRYAGYDYRGLLTLSSASPTIANTTLSNGHVAIRANVSSFPTLTNNTYINNYYNGFGYEGGTINSDSTWNITDTSYFIINDIFVATGSTLTVNPGVIVKFDIGRDLTIDGALQVQGTADSPVYFTSIRDDVVGGDTNGDGGASTPGWNNWRGIEFRDGSIDASSIIDHAVIRYAGYDYRGNLNLTSASPTIQNTTLSHAYRGILASSSAPTLVCNNIFNNQGQGIYNETPSNAIDARDQWWGSTSGPYQESTNPTGTGNAVTDGVLYQPWLTAPCGSPPVTMSYIFLPFVVR